MRRKMLRARPPPHHPISRIAGLAEAAIIVRAMGRAQKVVITMNIWVVMFARTMSFEFFFGVETCAAEISSVDWEIRLAVPDVEGAGVLSCFVRAPVCVGVEGRATRFVNCANVSGHGCRSALRDRNEKLKAKVEE